MSEAQQELITDLEILLEKAKAWYFTPKDAKDRKPIFALREYFADLNEGNTLKI